MIGAHKSKSLQVIPNMFDLRSECLMIPLNVDMYHLILIMSTS